MRLLAAPLAYAFDPILDMTHCIPKQCDTAFHIGGKVRVHYIDVPFVRLLDAAEDGAQVRATEVQCVKQLFARGDLDRRSRDVTGYLWVSNRKFISGDEGDNV